MTKIPKVGAVSAKNLISYCGGAEGVFRATKRELMRIPGIGELMATNILKHDVLKIAEQELSYIEREGIRVLFYSDEAYPSRLKHYNDCPAVLYYKGTSDLNAGRIIGIVGTRKPTAQGMAICENIVAGLQAYGVLILSGLAYGIDITAHRKAVNLKMETIGVMGSGLGNIYPAQHKRTALAMMQHGGLLTEYTFKVGPERDHFPTRNRIIAGLCDALVVVETAKSGGSIISANKAFDYNKDVFAVPGRPTDKLSSGCNNLIKSNKAILLEEASEIAEILNWDTIDNPKTVQRQLFTTLSPEEQQIFDALKSREQVSLDTLSYQTNLPSSKLASLLLNMEFKGLIKSLPGKRYVVVK